MSTLATDNIPSKNRQSHLLQFVLSEKANKRFLLIAILGGIIQFSIFKLLYPFPDFISDSYSYISTNLYDMKVNLWPIGYSKFILYIHFITSSHVFLVWIQYLILEVALLYFFFSVLYLFSLSKTNRTILFIFLFFNPAFLYLSNCVLSDALFSAITLVLLTLQFRMYRYPSLSNIFLQAVLIGSAFMLRYTAIYYPFVSLVAIFLSGYKLPVKLAGITGPWIIILPFIIYTQQRTKEVTGTAEFSVFGGWQLANNALYMYPHITVDSTKIPDDTRALDRLARNYFIKVPPEYRVLESVEGTYFIKVPNAILKPYMFARYDFEDAPGQFVSWGKVSPVYKKYGSYLIREHPIAFARYYLWLNTKNYFIPYLEKFGFYNVGENSVGDPVVKWFGLKNNIVSLVPSIEFQGSVFFIYPYLFLILNIFFAASLVYSLLTGVYRRSTRHQKFAIIVVVAFLLLNFAFSVFATPVVLRYQIVPMILLLTFSLVLSERIDQPAGKKKSNG